MALIHPPIYVASFYFPDLAESVQRKLPNVTVKKIEVRNSDMQLDETDLTTLQECAEVLFCDTGMVGQCLNGFKKIKWVHAKGAGVNSVMRLIDRNKPPGFIVTRTTSNCLLIGEYVMTYILALEKNIVPLQDAQKKKQWRQFELAGSRSISSLTVCVVGVGVMGKEVARRCKQLGMRVYGVTRTAPETKSEHIDVYKTRDQLGDALEASDYVCTALPSTPETMDMLSGDVLSVCKHKKPVLINVGRGDVIDEETLVKAITEGWIGGAVLDVAPKEPLPKESPLWTLPNVYITPHLAGYSRSDHNINSYVDAFVDNYRRYCEGQPLANIADYQKGY